MTPSDRLAALEERVAALEAESRPAATPDTGESGEVGYQGTVRLDGELAWTIRYSPAAVLELPPGGVAEVLAALGHPVRLALVRRLLTGSATAAELQAAAELSSTGQVYHHLRGLAAARVVEQDGRSYLVPKAAVVPLLTAILAAADVAGELRRIR